MLFTSSFLHTSQEPVQQGIIALTLKKATHAEGECDGPFIQNSSRLPATYLMAKGRMAKPDVVPAILLVEAT